MQWTLRAAAAVVAASLVAGSTAAAGPRIVNGLPTQAFPTTGALLYSGGASPINANNAGSWCSGTLIGCSTFLTAAHCVDDTNASRYLVYLQHAGLLAVSSITRHPSYNPNLSARDVAVVKLAAPATGIDPTTINTTHDLQALGTGLPGTIAGFGRTGGGSDYGIKHYGAVVTASCDTGLTGGEGNDRLVCWNYDSSVGAPGTDSNTCNGDSGGPLFMEFSGQTELVGVTSAGVSDNCLPEDHSWDASVYYNRTWIADQLGADPTTTCGMLPPVGDAGVVVQADSGSLSVGNVDDTLAVNIAGTPSLVRFTLNGTDNGSFNVDFFVKQGAGASQASFDCKADGSSVFGTCEFAAPAAGPWSIFVRRASGSGQYQVTTTVFGGDPPVCGNDSLEHGEACDGTDDVACPGQCLGDCSCPAPVCGDDTVSGAEQCDGTDDAACPGQCLGNCTCPSSCTSGDLYGLRIVSDAKRLQYKTLLLDAGGDKAPLDPRDNEFVLEIDDGFASVRVAIPANHSGWIRADPVKRKYAWKGDGSLGGLLRVKLKHQDNSKGRFWKIDVKGRQVPGSGDIQVQSVLDFRLDFDGTCHLESW